MRAGRLHHRLKLQSQTNTQDAFGGATIVWTTVATVSGAVEAFTGKEFFAADRVNSELLVRVVIRYGSEWSAIDSSWRIEDVNSGRKYDIKTVIHAETRSRPKAVIQMMCTEGETDNG